MQNADRSKILLTGASGQVGKSLAILGPQSGFDVIPFPRNRLDITDAAAVATFVGDIRPNLVINAAAYTAVDKAESEPEKAFSVNRDGVMHLARACASLDIPLLHYSTDYVFDGLKPEPYREDDTVNPLSVYGASKLAGEEMLRKYCPKHIILRVCWVFSEFGNNFVKTMLRLGRERSELRIVHDQHGCPTSARDIARASLAAADFMVGNFNDWGTYHFSSVPPASWYEFSRAIFSSAAGINGYKEPRLHAIKTIEYPTAARRPLNSVFDNGKFSRQFGIALPQWQTDLNRVIGELTVNPVS